MSALLTRILPLLLLLYGAYALLGFLLQRKLIYPRHHIRDVPDGPPAGFPDLEVSWLETSAGRVESWLLPPLETPRGRPWPLLVVAHGNASIMDRWPRHLEMIRRAGFGVAMTEYPGYGRSEGSPSEEGITEAQVAGYDHYTADPRVDPARVVGLGRSIGGGAVCALAEHRPLAALVLFSSFTSVRPFAHRMGLPSLLLKDTFDNIEVVRDYEGPVLVVHGREDRTVPTQHGLRLHRAAPNSELLLLDGDHNSVPEEWDRFWMAMLEFLEENGVLARSEPGAN